MMKPLVLVNPLKMVSLLLSILQHPGALGCLFPLSIIAGTQAMAAPSAWTGFGYFAAFICGMSLMMIGAILMSVLARDVMMTTYWLSVVVTIKPVKRKFLIFKVY